MPFAFNVDNAFLVRSWCFAANRLLAPGLFATWGSHVDIGQEFLVRSF